MRPSGLFPVAAHAKELKPVLDESVFERRILDTPLAITIVELFSARPGLHKRFFSTTPGPPTTTVEGVSPGEEAEIRAQAGETSFTVQTNTRELSSVNPLEADGQLPSAQMAQPPPVNSTSKSRGRFKSLKGACCSQATSPLDTFKVSTDGRRSGREHSRLHCG